MNAFNLAAAPHARSLVSLVSLQEGIRNRTELAEPNRTEPNRLIPEPAGTGRGNEPNQIGPSHDASEKRRPNRVEPGNINFRTEPNRTDYFSKITEPKRIEPVPSCLSRERKRVLARGVVRTRRALEGGVPKGE